METFQLNDQSVQGEGLKRRPHNGPVFQTDPQTHGIWAAKASCSWRFVAEASYKKNWFGCKSSQLQLGNIERIKNPEKIRKKNGSFPVEEQSGFKPPRHIKPTSPGT